MALALALALALSVIAAPPTPALAATTGDIRATLDDAAYSWWAQPMAVNDGSYTWVGGITSTGTVRVAQVRRDTGAVRWATLGQLMPDDHNTPAIAFDAGQPHLVVFYTNHGSDSIMRYRTVNRSTLAVGVERRLTFSAGITYAQVLRSGSRLVLFTRVGLSTWRYRVSDDFGATWGTEKVFVDATGHGQVYLVAKPVTGDADTNTVAFYGHPVNSTYRDVEYGSISLATGAVRLADGRVVGDLDAPGGPTLRPGQLSIAIQPSAGFRVRLLDVGTVAGRPAVSYAVWSGTTGPASYKVKMYRDGAWTSPPWSLASGQPFGYDPATHYVGGMVIGRHDRLYSARRDDASGVWYVEQWRWSETAGAGTGTFAFERQVARDDARPLVRPYVPARTGPTDVIVQRIDHYDGYTDYRIDTLIL